MTTMGRYHLIIQGTISLKFITMTDEGGAVGEIQL